MSDKLPPAQITKLAIPRIRNIVLEALDSGLAGGKSATVFRSPRLPRPVISPSPSCSLEDQAGEMDESALLYCQKTISVEDDIAPRRSPSVNTLDLQAVEVTAHFGPLSTPGGSAPVFDSQDLAKLGSFAKIEHTLENRDDNPGG